MVRLTNFRSVSDAVAVPVISEDVIRSELRRILASVDFDAPERVHRFLAYVVDETLAGRADRIKAYAIATEVFGRGADCDMMNDPVVRIEAGRLRRELERYYLLEGRTDPLVIDIARGGYVPSFRWRLNHGGGAGQHSSPALQPSGRDRPRMIDWRKRPWLVSCTSALVVSAFVAFLAMADRPIPAAQAKPVRPSLVVKPFVNLAGKTEAQVFAAALTEEILSQLAAAGGLTVFRSEALDAIAPAVAAQIHRQFGRRHILEGVIRAVDGKLRITTRLLKGETTAIIWSGIFEADLNASSGFDLETTLAAKIAAAVSLRLHPAAYGSLQVSHRPFPADASQ